MPEGSAGSSSVARVREALASAGLDARVLELPDSTRTAPDAARALGCRVEQIAKSLIFRRVDDDGPVLVIASGKNRVDEALIATHLGTAIAKADAAYVRDRTGFAIGGVPPVGHRTPVVTIVDLDLVDLDVIWAAAGSPHAVFSLTPSQLLALTGGHAMVVAHGS